MKDLQINERKNIAIKKYLVEAEEKLEKLNKMTTELLKEK